MYGFPGLRYPAPLKKRGRPTDLQRFFDRQHSLAVSIFAGITSEDFWKMKPAILGKPEALNGFFRVYPSRLVAFMLISARTETVQIPSNSSVRVVCNTRTLSHG